jgi:uncharacterized protein (DUF1778 family)
MPDDARAKTARIDLRMTPQAKALLEQAARARHKTLSEFVLDQSLSAAEETLADRRLFLLDDAQWVEFNRRLDAPPRDMPNLRELAQRKAPWDAD